MQNENKNAENFVIEDIVSSSSKRAKPKKHPVENYGKGIFKSLGTIIKAIGFLVAFAVLAVFLLAAFLLYSRNVTFSVIAIGIVIFGVIVSTIIMFLIFGLGHVICQNNEILRKLDDMDYYK